MIYLTTGHTKWSQPDHTFHFFDLVGSKSKKGYHTILISLDNFSRTLGYHCIEVYTFVPELSSFELFKGPADEVFAVPGLLWALQSMQAQPRQTR